MNKILSTKQIVIAFFLMSLIIISSSNVKAASLDSKSLTAALLLENTEPTVSISHTCECIIISIAADNGVDFIKTVYSIEMDGSDVTNSLECVEAGDETTKGTITCCMSGGLDEGCYDVEVTPADMEGNIGVPVSSSFCISYMVKISPSFVELSPGETQQFSASTTCNGSNLMGTYSWEFDFGCIGSTSDPVYRTGEPAPGNTTCTDTIKVTDVDNGNISDTATVVVSIPTTTTSFPSSTTTTSIICASKKIYGEYSEETELLRYFRDNVLSQSPEGQEIIRLYYEWSPAIVKAMEEDEAFKEEVKGMIDGVLMLIAEESE